MRAADDISVKSLSKLNEKLEELCGVIYHMGQILLLEHSQDPDNIDIEDVGNLVNFKETVVNEKHTIHKNINTFQQIFLFHQQTSQIYVLLTQNEDRTPLSPPDVE